MRRDIQPVQGPREVYDRLNLTRARYRADEVKHICSFSNATLWRRVKEGRLTPVYDGSTPYFTVENVAAYLLGDQQQAA